MFNRRRTFLSLEFRLKITPINLAELASISRNLFQSRCPRWENMEEKGRVWSIPTRGTGIPWKCVLHQQNYGSRQREGSRLRMTICRC